MKKALALLLVGMMATAGVAQASEVMENEGAVFEELHWKRRSICTIRIIRSPSTSTTSAGLSRLC